MKGIATLFNIFLNEYIPLSELRFQYFFWHKKLIYELKKWNYFVIDQLKFINST